MNYKEMCEQCARIADQFYDEGPGTVFTFDFEDKGAAVRVANYLRNQSFKVLPVEELDGYWLVKVSRV